MTHESLNQIIEVVIKRATRKLPAEETQTTASVNLFMQSSPKSAQQAQGAAEQQPNDVVDPTKETVTKPRQNTRIKEAVRMARQRKQLEALDPYRLYIHSVGRPMPPGVDHFIERCQYVHQC